MLADITNRKDIEILVDRFYEKVKADETIGYFFNEVMKVDWNTHLPKLYDFWETVLFGTIGFKGNPISKHIEINRKTKLKQQHFDQWLLLFHSTIDELFKGKKADEAKQKSITMAQLMLFKITESGKPSFIQ